MKIEFIPFRQDSHIVFSAPEPAVKSYPDWLRALPSYLDGDKTTKITADGFVNGTVKTCNPFTDSLLAGYTISLNTDIQVSIKDGIHEFVWKTGRPIEAHNTRQISPVQAGENYDPTPFKFMYEWVIKTPKDYSILFTHPLNRTDLPFYTLSGIVDTDTFTLPVNFPFLVNKNFEGILERGTPIVQIIPFKRESWTSSFGEFSEEYTKKAQHDFYSKIVRSYRSKFWTKKDYR